MTPLAHSCRADGAVPLDHRWRRSSFSTGSDATCVEVAVHGSAVAVRDSKDPDGPVLRFTSAEWRVFLLGVRADEFELPADHRSSSSAAASSS